MKIMNRKTGFSLVELSVVLIIIGLLIGGILLGKGLVKSAKIQAVTSDFGRYKDAALNFREKYYYWPGDFPDATTVWSASPLASGYGDGNAQIGGCGNVAGCTSTVTVGAVTMPGEALLAFQELGFSGFITGTYTNLATTVIPDGNFPRSPVSKLSGGTLVAPVYYYNYQVLGPTAINKNTISLADFVTRDPKGGIQASDAYKIDLKIDDGLPSSGNVRGLDNAATSTTCIASSAYVISDTTKICVLSYLLE